MGDPVVDATEPVDRLVRDLRTSRDGLSEREAARRLIVNGPNRLERAGGHRLLRELARQFVHPLALLLWAAAILALVAGIEPIAIAVVLVILVNAAFAFIQEVQAERAVEALQEFLPPHATVLRDGRVTIVTADQLVPGDVLVVEEGDRVSADARLLSGMLEIDASALTGESATVTRSAGWTDPTAPLLEAADLVFSGTVCTGGEARAVVFATGMQTELGRIAALSQRVTPESSPLEQQVRRVAWLIAGVALGLALAFLPLATLVAGLSLDRSIVFSVGLIVGNVPEGLLPVITLALAIGVRGLARQGAVVKRLSAVETLGSTDVICTDKTGTLTENRMQVTRLWAIDDTELLSTDGDAPPSELVAALHRVMTCCNNARRSSDGTFVGDATEVAIAEASTRLGNADGAEWERRAHFRFDPELKRMTTIDEIDGACWIDAKGAPESLLPLCTTLMAADGGHVTLDDRTRSEIRRQVDAEAARGRRVLALATRHLDPSSPVPEVRSAAERELTFLGVVALLDPPRPEVADAVMQCHRAGIRIIMVTGDHPLTAAAIAEQVGIVTGDPTVVVGPDLDRMTDAQLDALLRAPTNLVFARSAPEAKLRIADALRAEQHTVAMTGDGVNDAPALRRADIGVAMGRSGTDVAREAATMILTDDNFATIVAAVRAGRRVYDNVRKFIFYIFAHATPEVTPYLVFALGGGAIPLPLTVLQLLAFDVGTETLPALALGREPAEPGIMQRPPRQRTEGVIRGGMLVRAWLFVGAIAAALEMGAFFYVLLDGGWHLGARVGPGSPLHHTYLQATTMTFFSMVMCQIGTAFAARTERASLRSVGVLSNRLLLWGIGFELALAAIIIYVPAVQSVLHTAALTPEMLLLTVPFPFIVWGADELRRYLVRRRDMTFGPVAPQPPG